MDAYDYMMVALIAIFVLVVMSGPDDWPTPRT